MTRIKFFILLLMVVILSLAFFLTILFPEKTIRNYLANAIASKGFVLADADRIKLSFLPPGIKITTLKVETPQGATVLNADQMQLTPIFGRRIRIRADACGGVLDAEAPLSSKDPMQVALTIVAFSLEQCPGANMLTATTVKGVVDADIDIHFSTGGKIIQGKGKVLLDKGEVMLPNLFQPLPIDESFMHFTIEADTLNVQNGSLQNQFLKGNFEGTVNLASQTTDLKAEILVTNPTALPPNLPINTEQPTRLTITGSMGKPAIHIR